jgi:hypothetical protein
MTTTMMMVAVDDFSDDSGARHQWEGEIGDVEGDVWLSTAAAGGCWERRGRTTKKAAVGGMITVRCVYDRGASTGF